MVVGQERGKFPGEGLRRAGGRESDHHARGSQRGPTSPMHARAARHPTCVA